MPCLEDSGEHTPSEVLEDEHEGSLGLGFGVQFLMMSINPSCLRGYKTLKILQDAVAVMVKYQDWSYFKE